jgi:hypothetical protein
MTTDHPSHSSRMSASEATQVTQSLSRAPEESAAEHVRNALAILATLRAHDFTSTDLTGVVDALYDRLTRALARLQQPVVLLLIRDLAGYLADVPAGAEDVNGRRSPGDDDIREDVSAAIGLLQAAKRGAITQTEAIDAALLRFGFGGER